jgi:hypothetical protein
MKIAVMLTSVLLAAGVAGAAPTTVYDTADYGSDGINFLAPGSSPGFTPPYRYYYEDWGWDHDVTFGPAPSPGAVLSILSASLTVHAWQVDEPDAIIADGTELGNLVHQPTGLDGWTTSTFDLAAILGDLTDGHLDVFMNINVPGGSSGVLLDWAELSVTYEWLDQPAPVVPAPGAVILACMGTGLIGLLRRRWSL